MSNFISSSARHVSKDFETVTGTGSVGDLALAEVVGVNQEYDKLELADGSMAPLEVGMVFLGTLGNRQATKGITGVVPESGINSGDVVEVLSLGGILGQYSSSVYGLPTKVLVKGFVESDGNNLKTKDCAPVKPLKKLQHSAPIIFFAGSSMDSGKSEASSSLISNLNLKVAGTKLTGACCMRDTLKMKTAGAAEVMDFADAGLPSTVGDPTGVVEAAKGVVSELNKNTPDLIVAELGGGLVDYYNVQAILADKELQKFSIGTIVVANDVLGAVKAAELVGNVIAVMGCVTDTAAGKALVKEEAGVPGFNYQSKSDMIKLKEIVEGKLR